MVFLQLFWTFLKIGIFTFGGGYAMIALIQNEVTVNHHWLTSQEFTDILAVSQMTPGPVGINTATYTGYTAVLNAGYEPWQAVDFPSVHERQQGRCQCVPCTQNDGCGPHCRGGPPAAFGRQLRPAGLHPSVCPQSAHFCRCLHPLLKKSKPDIAHCGIGSDRYRGVCVLTGRYTVPAPFPASALYFPIGSGRSQPSLRLFSVAAKNQGMICSLGQDPLSQGRGISASALRRPLQCGGRHVF